MATNNRKHPAKEEENSTLALEDQKVAEKTDASKTGSSNLGDFVDKISVIAFPSLYIGFNIFYWIYYM